MEQGAAHIAHHVVSETDETHPIAHVAHQPLGDVGEHDLTAVRCCRHSRRVMNGKTGDPCLAVGHFTDVDPDPDPQQLSPPATAPRSSAR